MLRVLVPVVAGILLADKFHPSPYFLLGCLFIALLIQIPGFIYLSSKWYRRVRVWIGLALQLALIACSALLYSRLCPQHQINVLSPETGLEGEMYAEVLEEMHSKGSFLRYRAKITAPVETTAYIYLKPKKVPIQPVIGTRLLLQGKIQSISPPEEDDDFNFKDYAYHQQVYHQGFFYEKEWYYEGNADQSSFIILPKRLQWYMSHSIDTYLKNDRSAAILKALVCGDKSGLESEWQDAFSKTGSMHVLAVSGLHVGMLYLMLSSLWSRIMGRGKRRKDRFFFLLSGLWLYAAVTGFSPSVSRASLMFSFVLFSQVLDRPANINNSLAAAAVLLLCINPHQLFHLGFQLSFAAVWGIVNLQPVLVELLRFDRLALHRIWELSTVSISAQVATMPFSLMAFGNFPMVFLLANYVVIPMAGILLIGGLLLCVLAPLHIPAEILGFGLDQLLGVQFFLLDKLSRYPFASIHIQWPHPLAGIPFFLMLWFWANWNEISAYKFSLGLLLSALLWQASFFFNIDIGKKDVQSGFTTRPKQLLKSEFSSWNSNAAIATDTVLVFFEPKANKNHGLRVCRLSVGEQNSLYHLKPPRKAECPERGFCD
jgi:competence protein ComEC